MNRFGRAIVCAAFFIGLLALMTCAPAEEPPEPVTIEAGVDVDSKCVSLEQAAVERNTELKHPLVGRCVEWTTEDLRISSVEFEGPDGMKVYVDGRMPSIERFLREHRWRVSGEISSVSSWAKSITVDGFVELVPN